ncbi:LAMI_0E14928g1_1 [Lachancea mirantina]|uniref:LAMI_0E14928g1_1 n=1 Tax=Lachancea mirantina TaxID=1230905 RepID=A0A1G4JRX3_9SACH|nr:LAMI_0E14928g1_1 [Lachancea mirantina]
MATTQTIPSPTDVGALANRINLYTRDQHNKIDAQMSVRFAFAMKHGFIYRQGLLAFYYVFDAIEQEIDRLLQDPRDAAECQARDILLQFWADDFRRSSKIFQDLELLYADVYSTRESLTAFLNQRELPREQQAFVDYIHASIRAEPTTVLAYCHVLYLALFAGGRVMRSTIYRHTGLFPHFPDLTPQEVVRKGTNFFTFSDDGVDAENKLRKEYKRGYELATRHGLSEDQKLRVLEVSKDIFEWNMRVVTEIGEINRSQLMGTLSFRLVTFFVEEWKYSTKLTKRQKTLVLVAGVLFQLFLAYWILSKWL